MRWRPRFSLRTLVVFMLLVTSGVGLWWHWEAWVKLCCFDVPGVPSSVRLLDNGQVEIVHVRWPELSVEPPAESLRVEQTSKYDCLSGKLTWRVTHPQREPKSQEERVQTDKLQQLMDRVKRAAEGKRPSDGGES